MGSPFTLGTLLLLRIALQAASGTTFWEWTLDNRVGGSRAAAPVNCGYAPSCASQTTEGEPTGAVEAEPYLRVAGYAFCKEHSCKSLEEIDLDVTVPFWPHSTRVCVH